MADHKVPLLATEGIFAGLAKQNMLFHQCVGELVDNAIAACREEQKFRVDVIFSPTESTEFVDLFVADNGRGMSLGLLKRALQLGESPTTESRLNEHGFGLKNALATLSGGNGPWKIWTREFGSGQVNTVAGPFKQEMTIKDDDAFPNDPFLPTDLSTLIKVRTKLSFIQTAQGRGAPAKDLATLRTWLIEHLGVSYRGYLLQDDRTYDSSGVIVVSIGTNSLQVPPIEVPFAKKQVKYFEIELGGKVYKLEYHFGTLDGEKREKLVRGDRAKYYYQQNQPSQGVDIRLGKRVIATQQFETIWRISRHNSFNDFVGEVLIPNLPRGVLSTTNTKTDFNLDDAEWGKIFDKLVEYPPEKDIRDKTEADLRQKWIGMLKATSPEDTVTGERAVWPTGTKIDVFRKTPQGEIIIYELKVGTGAPINLYQLKMYWDGLVLDNKEQPSKAILLVGDFDAKLEEMANMMNQMSPPKPGNAYNFKIEKLKDKGL